LTFLQLSIGNAALALLLHIGQNNLFFLLAQQLAQHFTLDAFPAIRQHNFSLRRKFLVCTDGCHGGFGISVRLTHGAEQPCSNQP